MNLPEYTRGDGVIAWALVPLAMLAMLPIVMVAGLCLIIDRLRIQKSGRC